MLFSSLAQRELQPEIMDDPDLDPVRHQAALKGLARINAWSGSARLIGPELKQLASSVVGKPVRVLDIATGAGDVPIRLHRYAVQQQINVELTGCDVSPTAIAFAREIARRSGAKVAFQRLNVLADALPRDFDVITCSLFLHHLATEQAIELLRRMMAASRRLVLINDLERSRLGLAWAVIGTQLLTRSNVVHVDGPRSVRAAFTVGEALELTRRAEWPNAEVTRFWPCRFLLKGKVS